MQFQSLLDQIHGDKNYYWYLHGQEAQDKILEPLGKIIYRLSNSCLDIGCGEGWLSAYVGDIRYTGIDASNEAIRKARHLYPDREFVVSRFEEYPDQTTTTFDTLVFGNMLWLFVKPRYYVTVLQHYIDQLEPKHFIVYDLQKLQTKDIDHQFKCVEAFSADLDIADIPDIKRHRQIKVYECE